MGKYGLSATEIGRPHGLNGRETNRLLEAAGFITGKPGAWTFTDKGNLFGSEVWRKNVFGEGNPEIEWPTIVFDPKILDALDITPERISAAKAAYTADLLNQRLARAANEAEAEAVVQEIRKLQVNVNWKVVAALTLGAVAAVGTTIVVKKWGPDIKQKWDETTSKGIAAVKSRFAVAESEGDTAPEPLEG